MRQLSVRPNLADRTADLADRPLHLAMERPVYMPAKRALDILFALTLLVITAPVWLLVAVLIRVSSPGPVLYRQVRIGRNGRPFLCYKFRTMTVNADARLEQDKALADEFRQSWKLANDPRITPVGRLLRKTSIDELPQLLNVLRGEMSVVGPRPVQPRELKERFGSAAGVVTSVKPGLTSLWSVSGRSLTSYEERIALEVDYVQRRGFLFDLLLIVLTVPAVITGRGAV